MKKRKSNNDPHAKQTTSPQLILGVSGGIAAYKAVELLRLFKKEGFDCWVIMTKNATKFVHPLSFATFSDHPVITSLFDNPLLHIELQKKTCLVVAPATANIIGKIACGICDDALSTVVCAFPGPKVLVPAMNTAMWENLIVQENIKRLKGLGYHIMEPAEGELACGVKGKGRMPEPAEILSFVRQIIANKKPLSNLRILITAGRTEEDIDGVRVITNRSSGKMGKELASQALELGADCLLIAGRMEERPECPLRTISVRTAEEMKKRLEENVKDFDVLIMAAAVSDYRPLAKAKEKIKGKTLQLGLTRNPDILKSLAKEKIFKVGFSLDTRQGIKQAKQKLKEKGLELIVANPPETLESDFIQPTLITRTGKVERLPRMPKREFAALLLRRIKELI